MIFFALFKMIVKKKVFACGNKDVKIGHHMIKLYGTLNEKYLKVFKKNILMKNLKNIKCMRNSPGTSNQFAVGPMVVT